MRGDNHTTFFSFPTLYRNVDIEELPHHPNIRQEMTRNTACGKQEKLLLKNKKMFDKQ